MYKIIILFLIAPLFSACSQAKLTSQQNQKATVSPVAATLGAECGGYAATQLIVAEGYSAKGLADVYNASRQTASCESVNLGGYTAAHANLPLNTHIKVTNQNTGKSVIIKINDRIRSSGVLVTVTPAVARLLGADSSFPVQVEAITKSNTSSITSSGGVPLHVKRSSAHNSNDRYYIIIGTYQSQDEAFDRFIRLSSIGLSNAAMETRQIKGQNFHMVRIGPFFDQDKIDKTKDRLRNDGLVKFKVVKN